VSKFANLASNFSRLASVVKAFGGTVVQKKVQKKVQKETKWRGKGSTEVANG
jgi:hypothetical protein